MKKHVRFPRTFENKKFNGTKVQLATSQKHLGLILDSKLDFNEHMDIKITKCNKIVDI